MATKSFIPSVLSCEKKLVPSDARFYGTQWNHRAVVSPLQLIEKSVRGTISNRVKAKDALKLDAEVSVANLQTVDACALSNEQDTLKVAFTLKVLSGVQNPTACNNVEFLKIFQSKVQDYIDRTHFQELAKRYALNIANARFLWRNRIGAQQIEVIVKTDGKQLVFNASEYPLNFDPNQTDTQLDELSELISQTLSGQRAFLLIEIEAYAQVGNAQEVYPSEELVLDKSQGKNKKSKILFSVDGIAAMHSQKVGNAIRTIDTWYPGYTQFAIAIEPYGSVTNLGEAFRKPQTKKDFYTLFDKYMKGDTLSPEEEHYVVAVLVRGGIFGDSNK